MAINQQGIAINIKAFLPMGKSLDDQLAALSIVKAAHETGDYSALLKAAHSVEVKTEQKTRRVEIKPEPKPEGANAHGIGPDTDGGQNPDYQPEAPTTEEIAAAEAGPETQPWAEQETTLPFEAEPAPEQKAARSSKKANGNE